MSLRTSTSLSPGRASRRRNSRGVLSPTRPALHYSLEAFQVLPGWQYFLFTHATQLVAMLHRHRSLSLATMGNSLKDVKCVKTDSPYAAFTSASALEVKGQALFGRRLIHQPVYLQKFLDARSLLREDLECIQPELSLRCTVQMQCARIGTNC